VATDSSSPPAGEVARLAARGGVRLLVRTIAIRVITLLGTIILARLLSPTDYGAYVVVGGLLTLAALIGDAGFGATLVQQRTPPTNEEIATAWSLQVGASLVALALVWALAPALAGMIPGLPDGATYIRWFALVLPIAALRGLPSVLLEREFRFGAVATAEVLGQVALYLTAITLAASGAGAWSFVPAALAQAAIGAIVVNVARGLPARAPLDRTAARRLFRYGIAFQAVSGLAWSRDGLAAPVVGVAAGTAAAGLVGLGLRFGTLLSGVEEVVARVAFPALSRLRDDPVAFRRALAEIATATAIVVVPGLVWFAAASPVLVPLVLGDGWGEAVVPVQVICLAFTFRAPIRYLRQALQSASRSAAAVAVSAVGAGATLALAALGAIAAGAPGAALGILAGSAIAVPATVALAGREVPLAWGRLVWIHLAASVAALAAMGVTGAIDGVPGLAASGVGFGLIYLALVWPREQATARWLLRLVRSGPPAGGQ
jgi:PST family polysaccharide transporter